MSDKEERELVLEKKSCVDGVLVHRSTFSTLKTWADS